MITLFPSYITHKRQISLNITCYRCMNYSCCNKTSNEKIYKKYLYPVIINIEALSIVHSIVSTHT
jgi:hypothetical protein